jgi:hypothetical protein
LIDRRGVAGTLRLIAVNCFDRSKRGDDTWWRLGTWLGVCAERAHEIAPTLGAEGSEKEDWD